MAQKIYIYTRFYGKEECYDHNVTCKQWLEGVHTRMQTNKQTIIQTNKQLFNKQFGVVMRANKTPIIQ